MTTYGSLGDFLDCHRRLFVLTGAGCSTESGIPDYRDAAGAWKRAQPVGLQSFLADLRVRQRYWARSLVGWPRIRSAEPNAAHRALATLESEDRIERLVTQNVDGLHSAAGTRNVLDLHGRVDRVRCVDCGRRWPRDEFQAELMRRNPRFAVLDALDVPDAPDAPDGDADLEDVDFSSFDVPSCGVCDGVVKTDVVFFGENVPRERVETAMVSLRRADAMLVVGSSLMVYSGYRFAKASALDGKPIAAINIGCTRADHLLALKVVERCATVLEDVCRVDRGRKLEPLNRRRRSPRSIVP